MTVAPPPPLPQPPDFRVKVNDERGSIEEEEKKTLPSAILQTLRCSVVGVLSIFASVT